MTLHYNPTNHLNLHPEEEARALDGLARLFSEQAESSQVDFVRQNFAEQNEPMPVGSIIDTDTYRLAIESNQIVLARVWSFAHDLARETDNSGTVNRVALAEYLERHEIVRTESSFRNILERGVEAGFWRFDRVTDRIYLVADTTLNKRFTSLCRRKNKLHLIDTNRPGDRRVYVDLHGGIAEVEARVFNAWMSLAAERHEKRFRTYQIQIAHDTLRDLWGRSRNTLKKWMRLAGIKMQAAYTESDIHAEDDYTEIRKDLVPEYAYPILTKSGQQLEAWRLPNIYTPKPVKRHERNGNRHKVRRAVNSKLFQPADSMHGGFKRSALTKRIYFNKSWHLQKVNNKHVEVSREGFKTLRLHLPKHGDVATRSHYVWIGKRQYRRNAPIAIFEASTGNLWRNPSDRDFKRERSPEFRAQRTMHRVYRMGVQGV